MSLLVFEYLTPAALASNFFNIIHRGNYIIKQTILSKKLNDFIQGTFGTEDLGFLADYKISISNEHNDKNKIQESIGF